VIVDDVLATDGTLAAAARLLNCTGANVTVVPIVVDLVALGGRKTVALFAGAQLEPR
jgi:adenine phosphoribosyltransferase